MSLLQRRVIYPTLTQIPETVYKKGALSVVKYLPGINFLVLVSKTISNTDPFTKMLEKSLGKKQNKVEIIQNSFQETVLNITDKYKSWPPDVIIAIGGGAVLDSAKVIRHFLSFPEDNFQTLAKKFTNQTPKVKLVLIPTTPNTGSEVNTIAVVKDSANNKIPLVNKTFLPDLSVYDPTLLTTIPNELMKDFTADIFAHAFEGSRSRLSNTFLQQKARDSLNLLSSNIPLFLDNNQNLDALENILFAGQQAGIVAGNAFVGVIHALAHGLETLLGIGHGIAIRYVLARSLSWIEEHTESFSFNFDSFLNKYTSFQISIDNSKVNSEDIDLEKFANLALNDPSIKTDPIKFKKDEMQDIIKWVLQK